jgi:hypothetical protein
MIGTGIVLELEKSTVQWISAVVIEVWIVVLIEIS